MKYRETSFGGILLELEFGNIAINGGGRLSDMEDEYIVDGNIPVMMIVTCEHHHRSHNVDRFCLKHNVPLYATYLCGDRLSLEGVDTTYLGVPDNKFFLKYCFEISLVPVFYDSVEPFYLTVRDTENTLGIVCDGKIFPKLNKELLDCDTVLLGNKLDIPANAPTALVRRLKSVYNTQEELNEIFKDYPGELCYI